MIGRVGRVCEGGVVPLAQRLSVCALPTRVPWFDSPGSPAHFVSQAVSLVRRRVLVADATLKRPKDFGMIGMTDQFLQSGILMFRSWR
jgi:hypothetical protein